MKRILTLLVLLFPALAQAQNWQCLQSGVKHYFTNSNGYLRGIRIDSVKVSGDSTIYYPYHTTRGAYRYTTALDTNGGSWLGKAVVQRTDGTFIFDDLWQDSIVIKTQANAGDTWIFYKDTTSLYYEAALTAEDTMTVSGMLDSIKEILITAHNTTGIVATAPADSFQIILSKNNGFVQVFDLYTFPYHKPDTAYDWGNDFYLDFIIQPFWCYGNPPIYSNLIFTQTQLIDPTYTQLYDWNPGDVFENSIFNGRIPNDGTYPYEYYFDSITGKITVPGGIQFNFSGWKAIQHLSLLPGSINPSVQYPYDTSSNNGAFMVSDGLLIDTSSMPEEKDQGPLQYYFPGDTSYCLPGSLYRFVYLGPSNYAILCSEASPTMETYKIGIGLLNYDWNVLGGSPPLIQDTTLRYYVKNGIPCGKYVYPYPINNIAFVTTLNVQEFHVYPNPASDEVTIQSSNIQPCIISIINMLGQTVKTTESNNNEVTISVGDVPAGIYNVSVTDNNGARINQKIVIVH